MTFSVLCESPGERHLRRSVPRSVFAALFLSAFIYFLAQMDRGFEILFTRFEICGFICMCGRAAKAPDCKSGGRHVLRGCESYRMHQNFCRDVGLTGKPPVSKIEILSSNLSVPANLKFMEG
jgi:hypothetical protein